MDVFASVCMHVVTRVHVCIPVCVPQCVGANGGEDVLARWPTSAAGGSVEEGFGGVLKYLADRWDSLAATGEKGSITLHYFGKRKRK